MTWWSVPNSRPLLETCHCSQPLPLQSVWWEHPVCASSCLLTAAGPLLTWAPISALALALAWGGSKKEQ